MGWGNLLISSPISGGERPVAGQVHTITVYPVIAVNKPALLIRVGRMGAEIDQSASRFCGQLWFC